MSFGLNYQSHGGTLHEYSWPAISANYDSNCYLQRAAYYNYEGYSKYDDTYGNWNEVNGGSQYYAFRNCRERAYNGDYSDNYVSPSSKRRKYSENAWGSDAGFYWQPIETGIVPSNTLNNNTLFFAVAAPSTVGRGCMSNKRVRSVLEEDDVAVLMSRDEIERCSPSRKDGIDALHETKLRYTYCSFIQNLGLRLDLPQTTIGTAMVLCHRFFVRRSHACHDKFLVATAALFLAAKSEETARPLNDVVKASSEILHKQDLRILSYMLPIDWFEQFRERITEAEQLILTTLNFELNVQHPYDPLTSILNKLGLSQTILVNLALSLVNEGVCTRLDARIMIYLAGGTYAVMKLCFASEVDLLKCYGLINLNV